MTSRVRTSQRIEAMQYPLRDGTVVVLADLARVQPKLSSRDYMATLVQNGYDALNMWSVLHRLTGNEEAFEHSKGGTIHPFGGDVAGPMIGLHTVSQENGRMEKISVGTARILGYDMAVLVQSLDTAPFRLEILTDERVRGLKSASSAGLHQLDKRMSFVNGVLTHRFVLTSAANGTGHATLLAGRRRGGMTFDAPTPVELLVKRT